MELKGRVAQWEVPAGLKALHMQCRLLVEAISHRTPAGVQAEGCRAEMWRLLCEREEAGGDSVRLGRIAREEVLVRSRLCAMEFSGLRAYGVFGEKAREAAGVGMVLDFSDEPCGIRPYAPLRDEYAHVSFPALAALETVLRVHEGSDEAGLWKGGAGSAVAMAMGKMDAAFSDMRHGARGVLLLGLSGDFEGAAGRFGLSGTGSPCSAEAQFWHLGGDGMAFETALAVARLLSAAEEMPRERLVKAAEETLAVAEGLPLLRIRDIVERMGDVASFVWGETGTRILEMAGEVLERANFNTGFRNN